jgi:hypothetical protein
MTHGIEREEREREREMSFRGVLREISKATPKQH